MRDGAPGRIKIATLGRHKVVSSTKRLSGYFSKGGNSIIFAPASCNAEV